MMFKQWIGILILGMLLFGCVVGTPPRNESTGSNATSGALSVSPNLTDTTAPGPSSMPAENQSVAAPSPLPVPISPPPAVTVATRSYTDPRAKITVEYPETWRIGSQMQAGTTGYSLELTPRDEQYSDDAVRISYAINLHTLEDEEKRLQDSGQTTRRVNVSGQEFVVYEYELEALLGKRVKERTALTLKGGYVFRILLSANSRDFDALKPEYERILDSVVLLGNDTIDAG